MVYINHINNLSVTLTYHEFQYNLKSEALTIKPFQKGTI